MPRQRAWEGAKKVLVRTLGKVRRCGKVRASHRALRCVTQCHELVVNASVIFYQMQLFSAPAGRAGSDGAAKTAIATDASRARDRPGYPPISAADRVSVPGTDRSHRPRPPGRRIDRKARACYSRAAPPGAPCRELSRSLPEPSTQRDLRLDFFRGLSLIFIFIDHIPYNVLSYFTLQSNTFFDAAEVFIFISGYTAALVYGRRLAAKGAIYATAQIWRRAWTLYVAHIFLFVLFIAEVSYTAATFQKPDVQRRNACRGFSRRAAHRDRAGPAAPVSAGVPRHPADVYRPAADLSGGAARIAAALAAGAGAVGGALRRGADFRHFGYRLPGGALVFQPARLAVPVRLGSGAGPSQRGGPRFHAGCCGWRSRSPRWSLSPLLSCGSAGPCTRCGSRCRRCC